MEAPTAGLPDRDIPACLVVPRGRFEMGENADDRFADDTERPRHRVTIPWPFGIGVFPVTVGEFHAFAGGDFAEDEADLPVVRVSWEDASGYCAWLSDETGNSWRLPSEAEWEYACRAGSSQPFSFGSDITTEQANFLYRESGVRSGLGHRTGPGRHLSNAFGLFDMHGNVCEWVADLWHPNYAGAPSDGSPWLDGGAAGRRVIRGGAWDYLPRLLRSSWRDSLPETARRDNTGFRVVREL